MRRFGRRSPAAPVSESGDDGTQPDSQPIGLFQLWPDPELSGSAGIEIDVDIVAVHGLGGHAYKTWTEGQKLWLRDFIPKDLPRARILTFGYNAGLAFTKSTSTIRDFAVQLLESLRQLRRRTADDSVKTIFVCHSLGGIVLKQALIVAHERSVTYGSVASSVKGVVFLGTPHRGSDIAYWSGILTKFANIAVLGRLRQDLLDNLRPKSAELGTICAQFVERGIGLQIFSLYERLTMPVINALVVDEMSAILHLPNETAIPLEADHQTMCKFLTGSNPNYIVVRDCIDEIIETLAKVSGSSFFTPSQDMFMRRLRVINEVDMLQRVPSSWGRSHEWLINHQSFKSWTAYQGFRVLWLYGGPGSGKTVLSKTIVLYLNQVSDIGPDTDIIRKPVYFFFDDKDPKTQTSTAFVSSILYQILEDTKTAFVIRYLDNTHLNISQPDEDTLWQCLLWIIERSRGIIFQFVVDAIDELYRIRETNRVTLLERLEGLLAADVSGHMRLLITDRRVPDEGFLRSVGPSIIDVENTSTRQVVEEYIQAQVRRRLEIARINPLAGIEVESKIVEISGGNFLMASLTWKQFADGIQIWSRDAIRLRIKEIHKLPRDLETIYCGLLNNLPMQWREEARRAFSILRISFERLSSQQLSLFVTIWRFNCTSPTFNLRAVEDERSDFEIYLHERCGYIVRKNENGLVNFAHQSAKDLFNGQSQLPANARVLDQYTMSEPDAHSLLFLMCMKVFQAEAIFFTTHEVRSMISQSRYEADKLDLPLEKRFVMRISVLKSDIQKKSRTACLLYALSNWFEHYVKATPSVELDMEAARFANRGSRFHMLWAEIIIFPEMVAQYIEVARSSVSPLLNAITRGDSRRLIKAMIESGSNANIMGPDDITPLSWAIICNRQDAFLALMRSDAVSVNFGKKSESIAVHHAASSPNPFFINYMVEDSRANLNCRGKNGRTPLLEAIRTKRLDSVLLLLEQPYIDVWASDDEGENALTMAFQHRMWEDVVLRVMRMDWNRAMKMALSTAKLLELARIHQWNQVENELLSSSSHTLFQIDEDTGLNPVSALVFYGRRTDFVHYLTKLSRDEIRNVASSGRYNLLHLCAHQDWLDLVEELMEKYGLHPVASDHANRTMLHWALEYSWNIDERKFSVLAVGNINQKDNDGMTPLHLAVSKRNMAVIRWLVAAQADIFSRDNRGFTPVHLAASEGYREGVEFFMDLTKRDFGKSKNGSSLIHLMSFWLEGSVIRRFVESRRTSVNLRDKKRCTPLHCAAQTGNVSAVKVLLEKGCQVDAKDLYGQTALHHAIRSGESEVPPILLQNDADMDLKDLYEQTCLHLSIRHRHEELTKWLISRKLDMVFERDQFGFTPLHRACSNGTANEVSELLDAGADILELDSNFRTPLEHAVIGRNESTTRLILQYRETDDHRAREWIRSVNTALRMSIAKGFPEIESILMEAGAWVADRSKIEIERFYIPDDYREDRWPLVTYRDWGTAYHADSYDPSTGSVRDNPGKQKPRNPYLFD